MAKEGAKMVTLKSSDGVVFDVEEEVAMESQTIKHIIEDGCVDSCIPLPNVSGEILAKVIEYCRKHVDPEKKLSALDDSARKEELKSWDADFVNVDMGTLSEIILAANYLDMKALLDVTCQTVADRIKDLMPEQVRKIFHIKNDYTPEEEEAVRNENRLQVNRFVF